MAVFRLSTTDTDPLVVVRRDWDGPAVLIGSQGENVLIVRSSGQFMLVPVPSLDTPEQVHEIGGILRMAAREYYEAEDHLVEVTLEDGRVFRTMFACPREVGPRLWVMGAGGRDEETATA